MTCLTPSLGTSSVIVELSLILGKLYHRRSQLSSAHYHVLYCDLLTYHIIFSCQALVKRSVTIGGGRTGTEDAPPAPSLRRRPSSPTPPTLLAMPRRPVLANNIQGKGTLLNWAELLCVFSCGVILIQPIWLHTKGSRSPTIQENTVVHSSKCRTNLVYRLYTTERQYNYQTVPIPSIER